MKHPLYAVMLLSAGLLSACAGAKAPAASNGRPALTGSNNAPQSYYDQARKTVDPFALVETSADSTYAFTEQNPVCVGGMKDNTGVRNEQRYLNALRGPGGEEVSYRRLGSCCAFKTPNGLIEGMGLLDAYQINWAGARKPLTIYINCYDAKPLLIPKGLRVAGL